MLPEDKMSPQLKCDWPRGSLPQYHLPPFQGLPAQPGCSSFLPPSSSSFSTKNFQVLAVAARVQQRASFNASNVILKKQNPPQKQQQQRKKLSQIVACGKHGLNELKPFPSPTSLRYSFFTEEGRENPFKKNLQETLFPAAEEVQAKVKFAACAQRWS